MLRPQRERTSPGVRSLPVSRRLPVLYFAPFVWLFKSLLRARLDREGALRAEESAFSHRPALRLFCFELLSGFVI